MSAHQWMTDSGLYLTPESKDKLWKYAQVMSKGAIARLKEELTPEELDQFWEYCDQHLKSGAYGLRYALADTFIPAALGLDA